LAALTVSTMRESVPVRRRKAWRVGAVSGVSLLAVLGAGAAAVAAGLWAPWATVPDGSFSYTLPSGVICEERVGDISVENPDVRRALQDIFATTDVMGEADINGWNDRLKAEESALEYAQEVVVADESPGTTTVADVIYAMAVSRAVMEHVDTELAARGIDTTQDNNMMSLQGQALCGEDLQ
jgi:hypothetical protein